MGTELTNQQLQQEINTWWVLEAQLTHLGFQGTLTQEYPVMYLTASNSWENGPQGLNTKSSAILDKFGYCYSEKAEFKF